MTAGKLAIALAAAGALALGVAGCGDKPVVYKQGQYQGKPDSKPWDNDQFKGNRVEWEKTVKARNLGQNEYARSTPTAN